MAGAEEGVGRGHGVPWLHARESPVRARLSLMPARPHPREDRRDPVVEAYRAGVDLTLIEENLRLSVEERFRKWMDLARFAEELRRARERAP